MMIKPIAKLRHIKNMVKAMTEKPVKIHVIVEVPKSDALMLVQDNLEALKNAMIAKAKEIASAAQQQNNGKGNGNNPPKGNGKPK